MMGGLSIRRYLTSTMLVFAAKSPKEDGAFLVQRAKLENLNIRHQANVLRTMNQSSILLVQLKFGFPIIAPPINANRLRLNPQLQPPLRLYFLHLQFLDERLAPESTITDLSAVATYTKPGAMTSQRHTLYYSAHTRS